MKMRFFIAIELPDEIKSALHKEEDRLKEFVRGNFVPEENFHINLQFLGFVDEAKVEKIKEELSKIKIKRFELTVQNFGSFPHVVWCGVSDSEALLSLQKEISHRMKKLGFIEDKKFHPHITLVRVKEIINRAKLFSFLKENKTFGKFEVKGFALLHSSFVAYEPVSRVFLL